MTISTIASIGAIVYAYKKLTPNRKLSDMSNLEEIVSNLPPIGRVIWVSKTKKTFNYYRPGNIPVLFKNVQNNRTVQYLFKT